MRDLGPSPQLQALINAAKADAPSVAARAKVWSQLSDTVTAATAAGSTASSSLGGTAAVKAVMGTLLGGSITVGLAASVLYLGHLPILAPRLHGDIVAASPAIVDRAFDPAVVRNVRLEGVEAPRPPGPLAAEDTDGAPGAANRAAPPIDTKAPRGHTTRAPSRATAGSAAVTATSEADDLAREASLLGQARSALAKGDPGLALRSVHATHFLMHRQLQPEGMAIEAQALEALGRTHDRDTVEAKLRTQYPESGLAR